MNKYVYKNVNDGGVVFSVEAEDVIKADRLMEDSTGLNPVRNSDISCTITFPSIRPGDA